jgi:hypothetical protein
LPKTEFRDLKKKGRNLKLSMRGGKLTKRTIFLIEILFLEPEEEEEVEEVK